MENQIEIMLSLTIIILAILAIAVYFYFGPNAAFYGLFIVAIVVMFYTWRRVSQTPAAAPVSRKSTPRKRGARRRTKRRTRKRAR